MFDLMAIWPFKKKSTQWPRAYAWRDLLLPGVRWYVGKFQDRGVTESDLFVEGGGKSIRIRINGPRGQHFSAIILTDKECQPTTQTMLERCRGAFHDAVRSFDQTAMG